MRLPLSVEKIFRDFEEGQKTFSAILNDHEGLVGLVLGYGREASLLAFQDNALSFQIMKQSLHPLTPSFEHEKLVFKGTQNSLKIKEKRLVRQGVKWHQLTYFQGKQVEDPYEKLNRNKQISEFFYPSWQEMIVDILPPNFSCIKNSAETNQLRKEYGATMQTAREAFRANSFLRCFLEQYCKP